MPSESESLIVGFFHAMRGAAKRARSRPEPTQRAQIPRPAIGREWWASTDQQIRASREWAECEAARRERSEQRLDHKAGAHFWERQWG